MFLTVMLRCVLFLSFFFVHEIPFCQTQIAAFDLQTNNIEAVQAFTVHDSVFFTYTAKVPATSTYVKKGYWIDNNGKVTEQPFNVLPGMPSCGITKIAGVTFYYFVGVTNQAVSLQIFKQPVGHQKIMSSASSIPIPGKKLLSATADGDILTIVSYDDEAREVSVVCLKGEEKVVEKHFVLSVSLKPFYKSSSGILLTDNLVDIESAASKMKMYHESDHIVISVDEVFKKNNSKTLIFKLDLNSEKVQEFNIPAPDDDRFNSFYNESKLYRIVMSDKRFQFKVYDVQSGKQLHDTQIAKADVEKSRETFFRIGGTKKTGYDHLQTMFRAAQEATPAILVEPINNTNDIRVVVANYFDDKSAGVIIFPEPTLLIASFLISRAVLSLQESPGIARYFYLTGNTDDTFTFEPIKKDKNLSIRQVIDEYEYSRTMSMTKGLERWDIYLKYKAYIKVKTGAIGIYQEQRGRDKKILLLKFDPR
jgi:hypothetical protein